MMIPRQHRVPFPGLMERTLTVVLLRFKWQWFELHLLVAILVVAAEVAAEAVIEEAEVLEEAEVEVEEAEEETVANNQTFRDAQEIGDAITHRAVTLISPGVTSAISVKLPNQKEQEEMEVVAEDTVGDEVVEEDLVVEVVVIVVAIVVVIAVVAEGEGLEVAEDLVEEETEEVVDQCDEEEEIGRDPIRSVLTFNTPRLLII